MSVLDVGGKTPNWGNPWSQEGTENPIHMQGFGLGIEPGLHW